MGRVSKIATGLARLGLFLLAMLLAVRATGAEEIRLRSRSGTFSVSARLNDTISLDFVLDTGATNVVIPADVVSTLLRTGTLTERDFVDRTTYVNGRWVQTAERSVRAP